MRTLSGIRATGELHLGNYVGAVRQWVASQDERENFFFIADLHGLTNISGPFNSEAFRKSRLDAIATFIAAGIDPERSTIFLQSSVPHHTELMWYLAAVARKNELERMTQWKDKQRENTVHSAAMFLYPTLMASDILLYQADEVPVGEDQRQHVEVTRDWAIRFNRAVGKEVFSVPNVVIPEEGGRIMDLLRPRVKMSKSNLTTQGVIFLDDTNVEIATKMSRASTDSDRRVITSEDKPGISNLISIYSSMTGITPTQVEARFSEADYSSFKEAVAEAVIAQIGPIREKKHELLSDPGELQRLINLGGDRAFAVAEATIARVRDSLGLGGVL